MFVQRLPIRYCYHAQVEYDPAVGNTGKPIRRQMIRPLLRNDYEVRVRNTIPVNQIADPLERKNIAHATTDLLGNHHDASCR